MKNVKLSVVGIAAAAALTLFAQPAHAGPGGGSPPQYGLACSATARLGYWNNTGSLTYYADIVSQSGNGVRDPNAASASVDATPDKPDLSFSDSTLATLYNSTDDEMTGIATINVYAFGGDDIGWSKSLATISHKDDAGYVDNSATALGSASGPPSDTYLQSDTLQVDESMISPGDVYYCTGALTGEAHYNGGSGS